MRKYQQLLLLIISIVCIVTLLFYRHEYLKLRSVLSVLDFFGTAGNGNSTCLIFSNDFINDANLKYKFTEPRSVWRKLDKHFMYSSFWKDVNDGGFIRTLTIGPKSTFYNYECRIWFEEGDIIVSEQGYVKYELDPRSLTNGTSVFKYFLKCFVQNKPTFGIPYGVLWRTSQSEQSVFSSISYKSKSKLLETAVCVLPDYSGLPKTDIIEFIAYYHTIGVSDFLMYDSGIQHSVFPFLESVSGGNSIISSVSVLPWNFPVADLRLERLAIEDDCLSRTFGKAKFVAIVSLSDYIVPKNNKLDKIVSPNKIADLLNLSMKRRICCRNLANYNFKDSASPLFLRKRSCVGIDNVENMLYINFKSFSNMKKIRIYEIPEEMAAIHQYLDCEENLQKQVTSISIPDYYSVLNNHQLLTLWKSNSNVTSIFG